MFDEIWLKVSTIHSACSENELRFLYDHAIELPEGSQIVEIGCDYGRSTGVLCSVAKANNLHFTTVDNFSYYDEPAEPIFWDNMNRLNLPPNLMKMTSRQAAYQFSRKIDLLFIDGEHSDGGVRLDIECWLPKIVKGKVFFHDYGREDMNKYLEAYTREIDTLMGKYTSLGCVETIKGFYIG